MEVLDGDPLQSEDVGKYFGDGAVLIYEKENQQSFSEARRERDEKIRRTSKGNLGDSENLQKRERSSSEDEGTLPDDGVKLSLRESDNLSNRELLANAHMGAAQADEIEQAGRDLESDLYNSRVKYSGRENEVTVKYFARDTDNPEVTSIKEQIANSKDVLNGMEVVVPLDVPANLATKSAAAKWAIKELKQTG